jgi:hypothetical protein
MKLPDTSPLQSPQRAPQGQQSQPFQSPYQGNGFQLGLYEGWADKTIYTLAGPVTDGLQHNVLIQCDPEGGGMPLKDYADWQMMGLEEQLQGCRLLLRQQIALASGLPAVRAIYSWYPSEKLRVLQEQIYVIAGKNAYRLTATFTKKTRKTVGPAVERMMLSFRPQETGK